MKSAVALLDQSTRCRIASFKTHAAFDRYAHGGFVSVLRILGTFGLGRIETTNTRSSHMVMNGPCYEDSPELWVEHTNFK